MKCPRILPLVACLLLAAPASSWAEGLVDPADMPEPLNEVSLEQRLGEELPLDAAFVDADGNRVVLGDYFGEKPVVLAFVYYECPMLCTLVTNGLAKSLGVLPFNVGEEFDVVMVSFDPGEGPELATTAKAAAVKRYQRPETAPGWHFLTGSEESIARLTEAAGFSYTYLPSTDEYAHASGILIVTPQGKISQYYYGIEYPPKDVRLALVEASSDQIGSVVDQILLYCYRYDPKLGKYTAITMRIVRMGGAFFASGLIVFLWIAFRREMRAERAQKPTLGAASR